MDHFRARLIFAVALLLVSAAAFAVEEDCSAGGTGPNPPTSTPHVYETMGTPGGGCSNSSSGGTSGTQFATLGDAQAAFMARVAMCGGGGCTLSTLTFCGTVAGEDKYDQRLLTSPGGAPKHQAFKIKADATDGTTCAAPPEDDCSAVAGKDGKGVASDKPLDWEPPDTGCLPWPGVGYCESYRRGQLNAGGTRCIPGTDDGCTPVPFSRSNNGDGTADYIWRNTMTGLSCLAPEPEFEEVVVEGEACNGDYCEGLEARPGCGYLNGDYVCTPMSDNTCNRTAGGSMNCAGGTPTPPVPDNGTSGVPAEPDGTIDHCTGPGACTTTNNYNNTTVGGSNRPVPEGSGPGGSGTVGPGTGSGEAGSGTGGDGEGEEGDDSASGGETCEAAPACEGDPIQCAVLAQEWRTRCVEPVGVDEIQDAGAGFSEGEVAGDLSEGLPPYELLDAEDSSPLSGGSCPAPVGISVMGQSISLDIWERGCEMALLFAPIALAIGWLLSGLMLIKAV